MVFKVAVPCASQIPNASVLELFVLPGIAVVVIPVCLLRWLQNL